MKCANPACESFLSDAARFCSYCGSRQPEITRDGPAGDVSKPLTAQPADAVRAILQHSLMSAETDQGAPCSTVPMLLVPYCDLCGSDVERKDKSRLHCGARRDGAWPVREVNDAVAEPDGVGPDSSDWLVSNGGNH